MHDHSVVGSHVWTKLLAQLRAQRWAAVWTVLQTCHAWREDQSDLETVVAGSEFDHLLQLGEWE